MESSLGKYIAQVRGLAELTRDQEALLARRWREQGDHDARNLLIQAHLRFVLPIVSRYYRPGASLRELIAEGNMGLLYASNKFDPNRGFRFATYAKYWIRAYASECAIANSSTLFRHSRLLRKVRRAYARASNQVGEGAEARRIVSERLQMSPTHTDELIGLSEHRRISLESLAAEPCASADSPLSAHDVSPEQALVNEHEQRSLGEAVRLAMRSLDARERRIVQERLMADGEVALTLKELGQEFGISRERVRQLESRVKRKLAEQLRSCAHEGCGSLEGVAA
jgi:RNA polymerase sigma-32 factor